MKQQRISLLFLLFFTGLSPLLAQGPPYTPPAPMKIGVVGLVHTHVHWILGRESRNDIEIVAIVEPNRELAQRYAEQHGYSMDIVYDSIDEMFEKVEVEAVCAFNTIYGHLEVVEKCAPRGIHVMVEKPLAVSLEHAEKMAALARKHKIHLLTNYETTWYGSVHRAYRIVNEQRQMGDIRKIVVHDGHPGPKKIGVNEEFLEWLTDPELNGGGALTDFGCYGANQVTWLLKGEKPESVTAITQSFQSEDYPKVEDEATIILTYPNSQAIIQASWNWPTNRKDIEIYCEKGYVHALDGENMRIVSSKHQRDGRIPAPKLRSPEDDPFAYLVAVIRGRLKVEPNDLSALENNLTVMEILDAAKRSAATGQTVVLGHYKVNMD